MSSDALIPPGVLRNLSDRSSEKRKSSIQEIDKAIRRMGEGDVRTVLLLLANDFTLSVNNNSRKGGLLALAQCAIALGQSQISRNLPLVIPPVLKNFSDQDARVRFYACESLFNICKMCRAAILPHLDDVFVGVCNLIADVDTEVKNGTALFDRLLREIVTEAATESTRGADVAARVVPLLRGHMGVVNPYVRQLLVGWITELDRVPGVDMLDYLGDLLEGLFDMLSDGNREVRSSAHSALAGFLLQIGRLPVGEFASRLNLGTIIPVLLSQMARERDRFVRITAVEWVACFVNLGDVSHAPIPAVAAAPGMGNGSGGEGRGENPPSSSSSLSLSAPAVFHLSPWYPVLTAHLLAALSDGESEIVRASSKANGDLMALVLMTPLEELGRPAAAGQGGGEGGHLHSSSSSSSSSMPTAAAFSSAASAASSSEEKEGEAEAAAAAAAAITGGGPTGVGVPPLHGTTTTTATSTTIIAGVLLAVRDNCGSGDRLTRSSALRWLSNLLRHFPDAMVQSRGPLVSTLLSNLIDTNDPEVLKLNLEVLARLSAAGGEGGGGGGGGSTNTSASGSASGAIISSNSSGSSGASSTSPPPTGVAAAATGSGGGWVFFKTRVLVDLVRLFGEQRGLLETKAAFIIRRLCLLLDPRVVYLGLADILVVEGNAEFASLMVELLNLILITSAELADFRDALRGCCSGGGGGGGGSGSDPYLPVFLSLYRTWVSNPIATLSLCLLARAYPLAARIVPRIADMQVTVGLLMQVDKLVQLLESPVFLDARMALLAPRSPACAPLLTTLYGLLMILPQGTAYATLKDRLGAVACLHAASGGVVVGGVQSSSGEEGGGGGGLDLDAAEAVFAAAQRRFREALSAELRARSLVGGGGAGGGGEH